MTNEELNTLLTSDESYRIERTVSTTAMDKFQEAICAFANDLSGSRKKGYLLIGVDDKGQPSGLKVDDMLMKRISGIRSDGNILPLPIMNTEKVETDKGDVLVVEVTPSFDTPVRYRGRTFIRIGPRRDIATIEEERILIERCSVSLPTFDTRPCREATIEDIDTDSILSHYLPMAISADTLATDKRSLKEQLASLRLFNLQYDCPTYAAIILFGKNPKYFMLGDYVQYVEFEGDNTGTQILNQREFKGGLFSMLPRLESFIRDAIIKERPVPVSLFREKSVFNYPNEALRELMMNAVMHRDYQSNMPTRLYLYKNKIEIMNPGGLFGKARPENFPHVNDYRNPVVAEAMKTLKYVNMFNHGVRNVQELLAANESRPAIFSVDLVTAFQVVVEDANVTDARRLAELEGKSKEGHKVEQPTTNLLQAYAELAQSLTEEQTSLIISMESDSYSTKEMRVAQRLPKGCPEVAQGVRPMTRQTFDRLVLKPMLGKGIVEPTIPDNPHHPKQRYRLTEKGKAIREILIHKASN